MILLDTDILTLYAAGHPQVRERVMRAGEPIAMTVVTRIEVLQGRFASVLKAADGKELQQAQVRLDQAERDLSSLAIVPIDAASAAEFEKLRDNKKLKKIGRADLLIASIALAQRATLVSRNLRHFREVPGLTVENWAD
jgi:tRNA(fMet)-specific endonuclease VapC